MSEPTCRVCYAATLTRDERDRFNAEPVTGSVYLCPPHEKVLADAVGTLPMTLKAATPRRAGTVTDGPYARTEATS